MRNWHLLGVGGGRDSGGVRSRCGDGGGGGSGVGAGGAVGGFVGWGRLFVGWCGVGYCDGEVVDGYILG
jgi:hypothetical protein